MNSKKSAGPRQAKTAAKKKKRATTSPADQNNLFSRVNLTILMLDRDLRIRRFTPQGEKVLSLSATDLGQPSGDIKLKTNCPDLKQLIAQVIETLSVEERKVAAGAVTAFCARRRSHLRY